MKGSLISEASWSPTARLSFMLCVLSTAVTPLLMIMASDEAATATIRQQPTRILPHNDAGSSRVLPPPTGTTAPRTSLLYIDTISGVTPQMEADRASCRPSAEAVIAFADYVPKYSKWHQQLIPSVRQVAGCVTWLQTRNCNSSAFDLRYNRSCDAVITDAPRGLCLCSNGVMTGSRRCGGFGERSNFSCGQLCAKALRDLKR